METKWEKGPVKLANGDEALIDAINEDQEGNRYTGRARNHAGDWIACGWHADGRFMYGGKNHDCNLAPPPKKTMLVRKWLVIHQNGMTSLYFDRQKAIAVEKDIFALIEIDRKVTEGEGLS
jgi:hypothetical protein